MVVDREEQVSLRKRTTKSTKKILGVMGSTRKNGATDLLLQQVLKGAEQEGAETDIIYAGTNIKGCPSLCDYQEQGCLLKDGLKEINDKIAEADAVVFASPVFGRQIVALLKLLSGERCPHLNRSAFNRDSHKRSALLFSQGHADAQQYSAYIKWMANLLPAIGFNAPEKIIVAAGVRRAADALNDSLLLQSASDLGKQLAG